MVKIIRSNRKSLALIVETDGSLVVRAPRRLPREVIDAFVAEKQAWIQQKQAQVARQQARCKRRFEAGGEFLWLGEAYPLQLSTRRSPSLELKDGIFSLRQPDLPQAQAIFERWYKKQARLYLAERLATLAQTFGLRYQVMRLSGARTRWGSCSAKGTISLNWRLVMAPPAIIDYVIIHELAHLVEKNHSPRYWAVVEKMLPDYRARRKWLKDNSLCLRWT